MTLRDSRYAYLTLSKRPRIFAQSPQPISVRCDARNSNTLWKRPRNSAHGMLRLGDGCGNRRYYLHVDFVKGFPASLFKSPSCRMYFNRCRPCKNIPILQSFVVTGQDDIGETGDRRVTFGCGWYRDIEAKLGNRSRAASTVSRIAIKLVARETMQTGKE